jgi:hypothetical protein
MTKDIESGLSVAQYIVDDKLRLIISFSNFNDKCLLDGDKLLKEAKFFNIPICIKDEHILKCAELYKKIWLTIPLENDILYQ